MEVDQGVCIMYELRTCLFPQGPTEVTGGVTKGQNWLYKFTFNLHKPFEWSRHIPPENAGYAGEENNACGSISLGHRWTVQILQVTLLWPFEWLKRHECFFYTSVFILGWLWQSSSKLWGRLIKIKFPTEVKRYWKFCWRGYNLGSCLLGAFANGAHCSTRLGPRRCSASLTASGQISLHLQWNSS